MRAATIPVRKCPVCGKDAVMAHRPFCSKRCADIDFGRWLGGTYVIPGVPGEDEDDEGAEDGSTAPAPGHDPDGDS